jgi:hypothetical protein
VGAGKAMRVSEKHFRRQGGDWTHARMRQQSAGLGSFVGLPSPLACPAVGFACLSWIRLSKLDSLV